jgi:hypothetical protein
LRVTSRGLGDVYKRQPLRRLPRLHSVLTLRTSRLRRLSSVQRFVSTLPELRLNSVRSQAPRDTCRTLL